MTKIEILKALEPIFAEIVANRGDDLVATVEAACGDDAPIIFTNMILTFVENVRPQALAAIVESIQHPEDCALTSNELMAKPTDEIISTLQRMSGASKTEVGISVVLSSLEELH